ncbi:MAG TPA: glycosyltransferase family 39 protein [Pyrinomonadaceae bacterium]|nr:glycosyltransferase family 39 protein [Pyrinomonadaceae bacterium]
MNTIIIALTLLMGGAVLYLIPESGSGALALCAAVSLPTIYIVARGGEEKRFLLRLFTLAVLVRIIIASIIYLGNMQEFFGGDANTYHLFGQSLNQSWHGDDFHNSRYTAFIQSGAGAWGMLYVVAAVYEVLGANMYAIQLFNASIGASTAVVVYYVTQSLFNNTRVSKLAAVLVAFFPSLILWSSQALKDGLIIMALALCILATLRLMEKITVRYIIVLGVCLAALLSLRFYIFYMMAAAVAGSFVIGMKSADARSFLQRFVAIAAIGMVFTWFGVIRFAATQFERYGNLQMIQLSRVDQARNASSGFGKDVDVQTTEGALSVIPIGLLYLLFAPFPWQLASLRQSIALPEMLVWWAAFPLLVLGWWYALKHRLRQVAPIVLFTTMLTLAYAVFQGNVGTAYRQRSQLLVFYFIFVAVGAVLMVEKQENRRRQAKLAKQELAELQAARILARRQGKVQGSRSAESNPI